MRNLNFRFQRSTVSSHHQASRLLYAAIMAVALLLTACSSDTSDSSADNSNAHKQITDNSNAYTEFINKQIVGKKTSKQEGLHKVSDVSAGVLHYSGDFSGRVVFKDSDCITWDGKLATFNAPHEKNGTPNSEGTELAVTMGGAVPVEVIFAFDDGQTQSNFIQDSKTGPIEGIHARKIDDGWELVFNGFKIWALDSNIHLALRDAMFTGKVAPEHHQRAVTLNGVLRCTYME